MGELTSYVTFHERHSKRKSTYQEKNLHLFDIDWTELFNPWDLPTSIFRSNVNASHASMKKASEKFKIKFKKKNPCVFFSEKLGTRTKTKVKFQLKENAIPGFKAKSAAPFAALNQVEKAGMGSTSFVHKK